MLELLTDRERFEKALYDAQDAERQAVKPKQERLETVDKLIAECEVESEGLTAALAQVPKDGVMSRTIKKNIAELEKRYTDLSEERSKIEKVLSNQILTDEDITEALQFREDAIVGMHNPTFENMRRSLEVLRLNVVVKSTQVTIKCLIPVGEVTFDLRTPLSHACISRQRPTP